MKLSFLIPSKNRLELLKFAVDSILRQNYQNLEVVISDNFSTEDYEGFVRELGDDRVLYRRTEAPVSVTENWNNALAMASGDYVLMLGDDDALAPGYLLQASSLIDENRNPDILYFAAYHYCYPNVLPGADKGYLADVRNSVFFRDRNVPFLLSTQQAHEAARAACDFRYQFGFNSQHFLFRAEFLKSLSRLGGIFQSPYPDTFAAVVSFLKAQSILVIPEPMVMIGISPKSFGYYYFNDLQKEGYEFLANADVAPEIREALNDQFLPGDRNNTNWLVAVEAARRALAPAIKLSVNLRRYRMLQMVSFLRDIYVKKARSMNEMRAFKRKLSYGERWIFGVLHAFAMGASVPGQYFVSRAFVVVDRTLAQFYRARVSMLDIGAHSNIRDAYNWLGR